MKCPRCQHHNVPGTKFCAECGASLATSCPNCGVQVSARANFCPECGERLDRRTVGLSLRPSLEGQFATMQAARPALVRDSAVVPIEDEMRLLTILFADMSSSVEATYDLDPEETAEFLNKVLKLMLNAILGYGGRINSFLGDGVLAFFGTPQAREDDAERAIRAALDIRDGLQQLGLNATAGISTGEVFLGKVGTEQHQEVAARGRAINLAARLQAKAMAGQILVSETTYRLARRSFHFSSCTLDLKGLTAPVRAYQVLAALARAEKPRGIEGLHAELQARDAELAKLTKALADLMEGRGRIVTIIGEAGVGKSRLIEELRGEALGRRPEPLRPLWLEGRCLETGTASSYLPFRDVFRDYFGFQPSDDDRARERRIDATLADLADRGELTKERVEEIAPLLGALLSVSLAAERAQRLQGLGPEQLKNQTFTAVRDALGAIARRQGLVLVLEDLHWADTLSLNVAALLLDTLASKPVLLLCLFRPDPEHKWRRFTALASEKCGERFYELSLRELSGEASRRLLEALLPAADLPERIRELILARAQGNPFFLEEVLRSLIDAGVLYRDDEGWRARDAIESVIVPESVQAVILSRVDRLTDEERHVLQLASVIGRTFTRGLLTHLCADDDALERALWELERRQLIFKERVTDETYSFKHVLTQEAVYRSILRRHRAGLHERIANAIGAVYTSGLEPHYEALAYHYERSTDPTKAVEYLILAGEKSRRAFLNEAAVDYLRRALDRLGALPEQAGPSGWHTEMKTKAHEGLGDVLELTGKHEEAVAAYSRAVELVPDGEAPRRARLYRKIGKSLQVQRRAEDAFLAFDRAEAALGGEPTGPAQVWWNERVQVGLDRIVLAYFMALLPRLDALLADTAELVGARGSPAQRAYFLQARALAALRRRRYVPDDETVAIARAAAEASVVMNPAEIGMTRFIYGFSLLWADRLDDAEVELRGTLERAERVGDITLQCRCLTYQTLIWRRRGRVEEVRWWAERALKLAEVGGMVEYVAQAQANLAWAARRTGDGRELERLARTAWERWQPLLQPGPYTFLAWIAEWPVLALELSRDAITEALKHARALLGPDRRPLPEDLTAALEDAVAAETLEAARPRLERAAEIATRYGYL